MLVRGLSLLLLTCVFLTAASPALASSKKVAYLAKQLDEKLDEGDIDGANSILEELAGVGTALAVHTMLRGATFDDERVYARTEELLAGMDVVLLQEVYGKLLRSKKPMTLEAAALLQVAARVEGEEAEKWLVEAVEEGDDVAKRNAILALRERRSKRVIPVLLGLLEERAKRPDTIALMAREALISLTGHDFELIEDWRNWWEGNKESFDPKKLGESEGMSGVAVKTVGKDASEFFGVKILSKKIVFVMDISGSMDAFDSVKPGQSWRERQRMPRTRRELTNAIKGLPKDTLFNVIAFNNDIHHFQRKLVPAGGKWKKKALIYVKKLRVVGGTRTDLALRAAFKIPDADTIILLSDGAPTKTVNDKASELIPQILQMVRRLNRLKKIKVFTFGFDGRGTMPPGDPRQLPNDSPDLLINFLKTLAQENGGTYTSIP